MRTPRTQAEFESQAKKYGVDSSRYETLKGMDLCVSCGKNDIAFNRSKSRCFECLEKHRHRPVAEDYIKGILRTRDRRCKLKLEIFNAYGGPFCSCCGETEFMFLELDHKYNDGKEHRLQIHSSDVYKWAKANGFPPVFDVLCSNCNMGKQRAGGICPHKLKVMPRPEHDETIVNIPVAIETASLCFVDKPTRSYAITFGKENRNFCRVTNFQKTLVKKRVKNSDPNQVCPPTIVDFEKHELADEA